MGLVNQHDSRRCHDNMAQTRQKTFYIDSLTSFWCYKCRKSIFGWLLS